MARKRSAKQRAASVRNLVIARRKRQRKVSFKNVAPGAIRLTYRPRDYSSMSKSPNKKQAKKLGTYSVRVRATGAEKNVGYKTYRRVQRVDRVISRLDMYGFIGRNLHTRRKYTPIGSRRPRGRYSNRTPNYAAGEIR